MGGGAGKGMTGTWGLVAGATDEATRERTLGWLESEVAFAMEEDVRTRARLLGDGLLAMARAGSPLIEVFIPPFEAVLRAGREPELDRVMARALESPGVWRLIPRWCEARLKELGDDTKRVLVLLELAGHMKREE